MASSEYIDTNHKRYEEILLRLPNHKLLDAHIMYQFINGLYPPKLKAYVKEICPIATTLTIVYQRVKLW